MEHYELVLDYFRNNLIIPRDWKNEDVTYAYSKNMLKHPFDKRNYIITHNKTSKTIYVSLSLDELNKLENKVEKVSWKDVFNGSLKEYDDIFSCHELAKKAHYEYFLFRDKVFKLLKDNSFIETDHSKDDLD